MLPKSATSSYAAIVHPRRDEPRVVWPDSFWIRRTKLAADLRVTVPALVADPDCLRVLAGAGPVRLQAWAGSVVSGGDTGAELTPLGGLAFCPGTRPGVLRTSRRIARATPGSAPTEVLLRLPASGREPAVPAGEVISTWFWLQGRRYASPLRFFRSGEHWFARWTFTLIRSRESCGFAQAHYVGVGMLHPQSRDGNGRSVGSIRWAEFHTPEPLPGWLEDSSVGGPEGFVAHVGETSPGIVDWGPSDDVPRFGTGDSGGSSGVIWSSTELSAAAPLPVARERIAILSQLQALLESEGSDTGRDMSLQVVGTMARLGVLEPALATLRDQKSNSRGAMAGDPPKAGGSRR